MLRLLLLSFSLLLISNVQANIYFTDYGDGLVIPMNANYEMDVNGDGVIDFLINAHPDELGFTPIALLGCFTSPSASAYNNLGSRELEIHEEGDEVMITGDNLFDYIDFDRGAIFSPSIGMADGWTDLKSEYIGFAVFLIDGKVFNGWMNVMVDVEAENLILKSIAYGENSLMGEGGLVVGQTVGVAKIESLNEVTIVPNPATEFVNLSFNYNGEENLQIIGQNSVGQEVYRSSFFSKGNLNVNIPVAEWTVGLYMIRFETLKGIESHKLLIKK